MDNSVMRWIFCSLVIVVAIGCASQELKQSPSIKKAPEVVTPAPEPEPLQEMVSVTANRLNLRTDNSTKSQILAVVKKNEPLTVLVREGTWIKVRTSSGKQGWVAERYTVAQKTPASVQKTSSSPIRGSDETTAVTAHSPAKSGAFTQKDAIALYNRYRQALEDGDFNAFLECVYAPAKPDGSARASEEKNPEEFTQMKDFVLELSPNLSASKILKFVGNDEAAILVAQTDLENADYITLSALKFATVKGNWKVLPNIYEDTFPSKNPETDKSAIKKALREKSDLQLAAVIAQAKAIAASWSKPSPAAAVSSGTTQTKEENKAEKAKKVSTETSPAKKDFGRGYLEVDGKKIQLKHAYVETREDPFEQGKKVFDVYLTDISVPMEEGWKWKITSLAQKGKLNYIEISINESEHVIGVVIKTPLLKGGYVSSAGGHTFKAKTFGPSIIEGSAFTKPRELGGQTFGYRAEFRAQVKPTVESSAIDKAAPKRSYAFNDSAEHEAIVKMLQAEGETEILETATSVGMSTRKDFATVGIGYSRKGETVSTELYLFKEDNAWVAYRELPTHKDHSAIFSGLAQRYCAPRYKHHQSVSYHDDSWQSKDPEKRTINLICSELINNQWKDHRLSLVYEYDSKKGWHITEGRDLKKPAPKTAQSAKTDQKKTASKTSKKKASPSEDMEFSDKVVDRFFISILDGDMATVRGFLDAGISPNVKRPRLGHSPLFTAVMGRHDQMAQMFLRVGGDPNFKDENGATPLLNAAGNCKSIALVKSLVKAGADVNAKAKGGGTALMYAEIMKCSENEKILRKAGAK